MNIRAEWVRRAEQEEGASIVDIIKRERSFGVKDSTIADSLEVPYKTFHAMIRRMRQQGMSV